MGGLVPQLYGGVSAEGIKVEQVYCGLQDGQPGSVAVVPSGSNGSAFGKLPATITLDGEVFTLVGVSEGYKPFARYFKLWGEPEKQAAKLLKAVHPDYL